ncbi:MAG: NAD+ synthase [Shimia sp.]
MAKRFRITLAQLNPTVGDIAGNLAQARAAWEAGREAGADLVMLPEMFLTGYQTQDLIRRRSFHEAAEAAVAQLAAECADGPALGIGAPSVAQGCLFNAYHVLEGGQARAVIRKQMLPHTDVFDEYRLYTPGPVEPPVRIGPLTLGIAVCEDAWHPQVPKALADAGAQVLVVPNGSPYHRGKQDVRRAHMTDRVKETGLPLVYLNLVGGQDDQVFDGASFALDAGGALAMQAPFMGEGCWHLDLEEGAGGWAPVPTEITPIPDAWEADYHVMVTALRDYMRKTGFKKVLLGMSGGIDSALVATIAVDALGAENVRCVMLPSEYTSGGSLSDAEDCAKRLGARYDFVPIKGPRAAVTEALSNLFAGTEPDIAEENIQSRLRGLLLMALSNKFGEMLLTTGNKSEVAVGYATIYGDMSGGYNPIKDLYKMRVFETCRWRNANHRDWMMGPEGEVIPVSIIDKPPSAELREDQKDEDSLPPYEVLDAILEMLVDLELPVEEVVAAGYDRATIKKIEHLIYISEYKRFQAAPGARLTARAFWLDRRYPIVNRWRDDDA